MSKLAALFSLHSGIFYSKNRSQADCQQTLMPSEKTVFRRPPLRRQSKTAAITRFYTPPAAETAAASRQGLRRARRFIMIASA
ncbi:hypothetical protein HMPREF9123_0936 [Neisseria bacilliformis ATCC BAA-1200]|uniref:Uncharacterized protein n=1 Tax=Neisseria bacilliformis ATCC BAA-1200 TaxID=888742 RepID=F2BB32_9NEIS|nr:hypothetical protein HMPREF9123_0936 [Neisseria bacilliformis ATCC BAA-1200]